MQTVRGVTALREAVGGWRGAGESVALVPTMGALHAGHMALVREGRLRCDRIVTSIFVNPMQFGVNEDLARYPRREASDAAMLEAAGCDLLWAPDVATMYPDGFATAVHVEGLTQLWDGAARPGHFDGVATIVAKLFGQVRPDLALFGEKDYQQLCVVRRMAADLNLGIEIAGCPTQRDDDGVALSSRNAYLTSAERQAARALPRALGEAAATIARGGDADTALRLAERRLAEAGFAPADYLAFVDADTLEPAQHAPGRIIVAAKLGTTRLIDNIAVAAGV